MSYREVTFDFLADCITKKVKPKDTNIEVYYGLEHLDADCLKIKRSGTPDDVVGEKIHALPGDIIFGKRRAYQRKLGVAECECIASAHSMVLRAKAENVVPEFLPYFMQSDEFMERAVMISEGSLSPTIKWKTLAKEKFLLPDDVTQLKIAELMRAFDDSLEAKNLTLKSLLEVKQSISSFAGKTGWEVKKLIEVSELIMGQSPSSESYNSNGKGMPFIQGNTEFGEKYPTIYKWCSEPKKMAKKGDVLITVRAPVGEVNIATVETCIGRGVAAIRPIRIDAELLFYLIQSEKRQLGKISQGSIFDSIDKKQLSDLQIVIPPKAEREKILTEFYAIENAMKHLQENLQISYNMRKKILNTLILGGDHQ